MANRQSFPSAFPAEITSISSLKNLSLDALRDFDELPNSARVRIEVVMALFACSRSTVLRRVDDGRLPAPIKFSARLVRWNVGELRACLNVRS